MYKIYLTKQAEKDLEKILNSHLKKKLMSLMEIIENDPYSPPLEKLSGDLEGFISRRINIQHRLIYQVNDKDKTIKILRMWTHYSDN
jgi:Txe/YoeB family toxin of toxin-antitoxin system